MFCLLLIEERRFPVEQPISTTFEFEYKKIR